MKAFNPITDPGKDPLGTMMCDYLDGDSDARVRVVSENLDMWEMTGKTLFRTFRGMDRIERKALSMCSGHTLDVGAGSGCHSLYLADRGLEIDSLDISCGSVKVMKHRQVPYIIHSHLFALENRKYDTLLMLMNGIGIVGSLDGLNLFFQHARSLLAPGGQILADSTDLAVLYDSKQLEKSGYEYYGQTEFVMKYKDIESDPFDWIYIDYQTLAWQAQFQGFDCEKIVGDKTGKFLARMRLRSGRH